MAKTNAMGLTDITALTSRIQELEREFQAESDSRQKWHIVHLQR